MGYIPNKAIHPGFVLGNNLVREGMTQKNLAERTGLTEKHISHIITGEASLTVETALLLENALGGSASFWLNLEKNFQETKSRIERMELLKKETHLLSRFPYNELVKLCYVEQSSNLVNKVENLWKFFGVNSLHFVEQTESVAYRKQVKKEIKSEYIAAWLRCGELESKKQSLPVFSETKLKSVLKEIKKLTNKSPEVFSVEVQSLLASCGVALVYVAHFPGTGVSGAVRWIGDTPVVQLTLFGAFSDIFWFNLFHEIGHIILHSKKEKFLEFDNREQSDLIEKEKEADAFASDQLINPVDFKNFLNQNKNNLSQDVINSFAKSIDLHPGIIAGRLCHEKLLDWKLANKLRTRLKFT